MYRGRCGGATSLPQPRRAPTSHCAEAVTSCVVVAPRADHHCPTSCAHQRPIAPPTVSTPVRRTKQRRVSWPRHVTPTAAPPPAPSSISSRRRGFGVCRGRFACRSPLTHPARQQASYRAHAETPCAVAAPHAAHRCPTPRVQHPSIAPTHIRPVPWPLRVPLTAIAPRAPTMVPSRRRGDAVCRGRYARGPLLPHPARPRSSHRAAGRHCRFTMAEEAPCFVAAPHAAHRCPTPRANQHFFAPTLRRRVS